MTRPRLPSTETLSSSKTHRRNSSVICNGELHSDRSDTVDMLECCIISSYVEGRQSPSGADVISSLRALELIRQLSFDTSMPEIIEIDTPDRERMVASPSTVSKYLPHLIEFDAPPAPSSTPRMASPLLPLGPKEPRAKSPSMNHVDMLNRNSARSTSFSEMSDSDGYEVDFDGMMMVMEPIPDQQTGQSNRRRLASDQSPYAVSSISSSSFCDELSFGEREEMLHWHDPAGYNINLGMNHVEASRLEEDELGPSPCQPRLSIDSLKEWNLQCEQEGHVIDKRQYIATALSPTLRPNSIVGDRPYSPHESVEVEQVHMMVAPSLSASLSYTHTGVPSTISVSSELHDVEEVASINYDAEAALTYSLDKSFESSLAGAAVHMQQDKVVTDTRSPAPTALRKRHRRHRSDGLVMLPRARLTLKKRPSHQRVSSLDISLQIIPESPSGQFVERTISAACDKRFEGFVAASAAPFNDKPCSTNLLCMHRRFNSDGYLLAQQDKAATE